ncbi:hypothetical protein MM221_11180 [Salipaludibacillus sp. LMS25]|jgi:hypothetical protein|uniref:hypothetical protein n=1 Tax=Salipaludibacillus sp. LMS25 TaxID=2924031 RepID=UPI0020D1342C|nr:hypothetical protein [Salipaludibacillus sp. LMS25]UTR13215.1 hypothetical protein MM221_11180 [Salipaludibacillus sp. LMS25]
MKQIEKFNVRLDNFEQTPFYQADGNLRFRIESGFYGHKNWKYLKKLIYKLFDKNEQIYASFLSGGIVNEKRIYSKTGLGKYIKIVNWKEDVVYNRDSNMHFVITTIQNVQPEEIYKYSRTVTTGHKEAYTVFYNETYLMYISNDVIDIIGKEESSIREIKKQVIS